MTGDKTLTLGSLFDGSGGFPLAGILAGVLPLWASEIDPFAVRVTTARLPQVKHYGDISALSGADLPPVDIITFGSPCQDMSIAGKRSGLDGSRSSLFYEAIRIIKEMREKTNGEKPRFICWENVPGAFSSNKGGDFKAVLEAVIRIKEPAAEVPAPDKKGWPYADCFLGDGWSVAYRVLDAQYWSVPQRRARIFLVADFAGGCAPEILFESEGVSGYSPQGFRAWQRAAGNFENSAGEAGGEDGRRRRQLILDDQGGGRMDVREEVTGTLRAEVHYPPVVMEAADSGPAAAGFCTEHSAASRSIGYGEETSPTLRAGVVPAAVALDYHPADSRIGIREPGKCQMLTSQMGTGGNNVPLLLQEGMEPKMLKIRSSIPNGGKGTLVQNNKSATLGCHNDQTVFVPYGVCSKASHAMLSDNPHSGFYEAKTSRTLDQNGGRPDCSQGGIAIVAFMQNQRDEVRDPGDTSGALAAEPGMKQQAYVLQGSMIGRSDKNGPQGDGINEEVSFTLDTSDRHAVAYCMTTGEYTQVVKEKSPALMARDYKDPPVVNDRPIPEPFYIVRRLTPAECARLQGFPDGWCSGLGTEDPSEAEIAFWVDVFETHRRLVTHASKPKTERQIRKWLADPYSDSAEYRLWGNGLALPCAYFVLSGIAWAAQKEDEKDS